MKTKILIIICLFYYQTNAQQTQQDKFEQTYWNYRDMFQKRFVKIGEKAGESMPISAYTDHYALGNLYEGIVDGSCNGAFGEDYWNEIELGADCMARGMWQ